MKIKAWQEMPQDGTYTAFEIDNTEYELLETPIYKGVRSKLYNYNFSKVSGQFIRWGKTQEDKDDPIIAPLPEIADIEISTICNGIGTCMDNRRPCSWCYKSNTGQGKNMSLETLKKILDLLTYNGKCNFTNQVAYGLGDLDSHPQLFEILEETRARGIIPNITTNGMGVTEELADKLANICGAVSVSRYHIPNVCYDAVKLLTDASKKEGSTLKQVNIHQLWASETVNTVYNLFKDIKNDPRLADLNATVLLSLKNKGSRNKFHSATYQQFHDVFKTALDKNIAVGMDSCTAPLTMHTATKLNKPELMQVVECCESTRMSMYSDVDGNFWPCSFCEETEGIEPINLLEVKDFIKEVWQDSNTQAFRGKLILSSQSCNCDLKQQCFSCPVYNITPCKNLD